MEEKVLNFLDSHPNLAFATVGLDNAPKLRVFQLMRRRERSLYFATTLEKDTHRQLQNNPSAEVMAMDGNEYVRIAGSVLFDVPDELCKSIFDENEMLSRLYSDYKQLVYFRLPVVHMDYYDLSTTPPLFESFTF